MSTALARRSMIPAAVALVLAANTLIAYMLARGEFAFALPVGALPIALIAFGALVARNRAILLVAALALPMIDVIREAPLFSGGLQIYPADLLLILAVASWIGQRLLVHDEESRNALRLHSSLLAWPTIIFSAVVLVSILRGHAAWGESYLGAPSRLFLYAAAVTTLVGLTARQVYQAVVIVFYAGSVYVLLSALFHFSSGTSQTRADTLSTGGFRVVALSVSLYMAAALFLALLNLELDQSMGMRALHFVVAGLLRTRDVRGRCGSGPPARARLSTGPNGDLRGRPSLDSVLRALRAPRAARIPLARPHACRPRQPLCGRGPEH
jgi:hypothetical protein